MRPTASPSGSARPASDMAAEKPVPLGWCLAGQHDTESRRGPCPIAVGSVGPCACECHAGATSPRGYPDGEKTSDAGAL